ncbi:MAG TPA: tRNA 2-thiouridine(34) synthase MnmA [Candidatus Nanoarchaeia archaeon]|nr:tRNA 2-thiouridine(34) synthase MnmA [Candidatus Nanoarchaeia archaeon]
MKKPKVLVAMSGGVDSSVAALLLKNRGFNVIGAFMKNWSDAKNALGECSWKDDRRVAMSIASKINIPLITLDFEKEYRKHVVDEMFRLYKKGITPNPDIDCNNRVKFPLLWKAAKRLGSNFIATGHYIRKKDEKLLRAKDESKDQSYFLYRINKDDISHSLFPIGELTKKQVREIAKKNGFPNFSRKSTVGICFIGKVNLKKFLQKRIKPKQGEILDPEGKTIGRHDGIYYYTIGQRIGPRFGIEVERGRGQRLKRWYVASKNLKKNEIVAAPEGHILNYRKEIMIKNPHWINEKPKTNVKVLARIRQVGELLPSKLKYSNNKYHITLNKAITGISEGQAAVLYCGLQVLGGGVIDFS